MTVMTELWYMDISLVEQQLFNQLLPTIPETIQKEVLRFKFFKDQKLKLFGRLLLRYYYMSDEESFNWEDLLTQDNGKPYISGNRYFNISHSGDFVAIVFSNQEIGVDVEEMKEINVKELTCYLHPDERKWIMENTEYLNRFYYVWTRKEAFFKANGTGLINGVDHVNCLPDSVLYNGLWHLKNFYFIPGYHLALCSANTLTKINNKNIKTAELLTNIIIAQ